MGKKILVCFLLLLGIVSTAVADADADAASTGPILRVGLLANQINIILSADADYVLTDTATAETLVEFKAKQKAALSIKNKQITINGAAVAAREISVTVRGTGPQITEVNNRHYRGAITIHPTQGKTGLTAVDTLPLEEYLYGVIPTEISPAWPVEAMKAQAVASRTYALYSMKKFHDDGYDVNTSTDCQVYKGRDIEDPRSTKAVNDTFGQVILYQGKLIPAFFHSDGGGYTESSENVWGNYEPSLRGVVDYDQKSPHYYWKKEMKPQELGDTLRAAGYDVGTLQAFELSALTKQPVNASDRGVSGRLKTIRIIGSTGSVEVSGAKFRSALGLDSTLFDIKVVLPTEKSFNVDIVDSYGNIGTKVFEVNVPPLPERNLITDKPTTRRIGGRGDETVVFSGYGWGHGLGLSQWGAKAMAEKASDGDTTYFKEILKHYYTGVDIQKSY
ncbi:MAG: SpoIID/LytB domain-containing protein [Negativicutes bacterium]|nr:SpoIID/LytB domain-containing protein [Negativicutes bacterium]